MSDLKSKLPDFNELKEIGSKLYKDIKSSVTDIISDYKKKRTASEKSESPKSTKTEAPKKSEKAKETDKD